MPPKKDTTSKPERSIRHVSSKAIAQALEETLGNVSAAASKLQVSRQAIYKRMAKEPALREAQADATERFLDLAEAALISQVKDGNMTAIIFTLKTKGKRRGWVERTEVTGAEGGAIEIDVDELERKIARLAESARPGEDSSEPESG